MCSFESLLSLDKKLSSFQIAIMQRTRLKNKANKNAIKMIYKTIVNKGILKSKWLGMQKRNISKISTYKMWEKQKVLEDPWSMFSGSSVVSEKIALIENEEAIRDDKTISEHITHYFANITDTLKAAKIQKNLYKLQNPVLDFIQAYSTQV